MTLLLSIIREKERILLNTFDIWKSKFDSITHEKKQKSQAEKNSYECDKCVYEATTHADLTEHKNNNHAEEEIKCEQCGLVVTTDANLKGHMEAYHEEIRAETGHLGIFNKNGFNNLISLNCIL